jgi:predicted O-methyltransferase YrrM
MSEPTMIDPGGIEGFTKASELAALAEIAAGMPDGATVVEIGSWKGRSTVAIASALPPGATLRAVDTFGGDPAWDRFGEIDQQSVLGEFRRSTAAFANVSATVGRSVETARTIADGTLDWVFIDALHDFRNVLRDIRAWAPKLRPGGLLSGHDYGRAGVTDAVRVLLGDVETVGSIWMTRERPRPRPAIVARVAASHLLRR